MRVYKRVGIWGSMNFTFRRNGSRNGALLILIRMKLGRVFAKCVYTLIRTMLSRKNVSQDGGCLTLHVSSLLDALPIRSAVL